jgi:hypothetical protein
VWERVGFLMKREMVREEMRESEGVLKKREREI